VRLWLNGIYWGVYVNVQQPNKDMMREWFRSNDGNRYRGFPTSGSFQNGRCAYTWLGSAVSAYLSAYQAKQGDGTDLMQMCNVLNNTPAAALQSVLPAVFNVDSFLRYAAVMNVTTNTDSYLQSGKDHFLYVDEVHGDGTTLPFDCNEGLAGSTSLSPTAYTTDPYRPAFTKTLQFADWTERYKAHLRAVVDNTVNPAHLTPLAQRYHAMIAADVAADTKKIYTTADFQQSLNGPVTIPDGGSGWVVVPGIVPFIQARHAWLSAHAYLNAPRAALGGLAHSPAQPAPTQPITFTVQTDGLATAVGLWWRARGPFQAAPMHDDGQHGDGGASDGVWGAILPAQPPGSLLDYWVEARTATGAVSCLPFTAELERACPHVLIDWPVVPSPIALNEFVAQNVTGPVDENGQHEDWLELYNAGSQPVSAGGMWLSDTLERPKWQIPAGTTIAPSGVLRVWCDEDGSQGPLHANFKLSAGGETVALYAASGLALHDAYEFGQQYADVSTGRLRDGGLPWVTFPSPTHLLRNEPAACGQRTYGAVDPAQHGVSLALTGSGRIGTSPTYAVAGGPAGGLALLGLSLLPDHVDLAAYGIAGETLLLSPQSLSIPAALALDGGGAAAWTLSIPNFAHFVDVRLYAQTLAIGGGFDSSRAIELRVCP
jgi:hypothetical protein